MNDLTEFQKNALVDMYRKATNNSVDYLNNDDCLIYNIDINSQYMISASIGMVLQNNGYVISDYISYKDMNYKRYRFTFKGLWQAWCLAKKPL